MRYEYGVWGGQGPCWFCVITVDLYCLISFIIARKRATDLTTVHKMKMTKQIFTT